MKRINSIFKTDIGYVAKHSPWLFIGYFSSTIFTLATTYVFANYLSPHTYGSYKYLVSIGVLLASFSLTGINDAIIQATARKINGFYELARSINFRYSLIITFLALIGAAYYFFAGNLFLSKGLILIALLQPLLGNSQLIFPYLSGGEKYKQIVYLKTAKTIISGSSLIIVAFLFNSPLLLLLTYFLSDILCNYVIYFLYRDKSVEKVDEKKANRFLTYAKHSSVTNVFIGISQNIDKIIIFQTLNAVELAIYTFALAIPEQYKNIFKALSTLILQKFSKRDSLASIKAGLMGKVLLLTAFSILLAIINWVTIPYIFNFFFPAYSESIFYAQLLSLSFIPFANILPMNALKAHQKNKELYMLHMSTSILSIGLTFVLIILYGLLGAVIGKIMYRYIAFVAATVLVYHSK